MSQSRLPDVVPRLTDDLLRSHLRDGEWLTICHRERILPTHRRKPVTRDDESDPSNEIRLQVFGVVDLLVMTKEFGACRGSSVRLLWHLVTSEMKILKR